MPPKSLVEPVAEDSSAASDSLSTEASTAVEDHTEPRHRIIDDSCITEESGALSVLDSDSSDILVIANADIASAVRVDYSDTVMAHDNEFESTDFIVVQTYCSRTECLNLQSAARPVEGESTGALLGASNAAKPTPNIHPFDMPCPFNFYGGSTSVSRHDRSIAAVDGATYAILNATTSSQWSDEPVPTSEGTQCEIEEPLKATPLCRITDRNMSDTSESRLELESRENLQFSLEKQPGVDGSIEEKLGNPSSERTLCLYTDDEDDDEIDEALRPPELMRQDAASGLVWSVSQPGAFREGGNGREEPEVEHDDWMMATRVAEPPTASVNDAHIIIHAAAVVDDPLERPVEEQHHPQHSTFVLMGEHVEAVEICNDIHQSPRPSLFQTSSRPGQLRKMLAAFVCAIFVAVTATIFVTVAVMEQSSSTHSKRHVDWPYPSPLGTTAPSAAEEVQTRAYPHNESNTHPFAWKPLGRDVDGQFENQTLGYSISLSAIGWIMAVGSPWTKDFLQPGSVSVYRLADHANWTRVGHSIHGKAIGEGFGLSVDISESGDILAVSAPFVDGGRVTIYRYNARGSWYQLGEDLIGEYDGQNYGWSVSLSGIGTVVASGAPGNANDTGCVTTHKFNGTGWELMGSKIRGRFPGQRFGGSVSLSLDGLTLAVGTIEHMCSKHMPHVRVYRWNNSDWQMMGYPMNGTAAFHQCAMSVALSADGMTVAAGAWLSVNENEHTGNVLVFRWSIDHWEQLGSNITGEKDDNFGVSVALSLDGNILAVGSNFGGKNRAGKVRVFHFNASIGEWESHGLSINGKESYEEFGKSVALSLGGRVVASGAYMSNDHGIHAGEVRVYSSF